MMRNRKRIIRIFDDDERGFAEPLKKELEEIPPVKKSFGIEKLDAGSLERALDDLRKRRQVARNKGRESRRMDDNDNPLDQTDILIVDFDLLGFKDGFTTGEEIAYLARCYSKCRLIIALNQFIHLGENYFDLTLKGHLESYADLNLTLRQLKNPGLWNESWRGAIFRPWYWPLLPHSLETFEKRVEELRSGSALDEPILEYLGFSPEATESMLRSVRAFLGKSEKVTFRDFVKVSGNGLRKKDEPLDEESLARIAAARVFKWLERAILPGQDILVDAPHLVSRFPSLLDGDRNRTSAYDKTAVLGGIQSTGLSERLIKGFRFSKKNWLSRPAWFWSEISGCEDIPEVARPWETDAPNLVFCEDVSRFLPRDAAKEFIADFPSPFARRFVVDCESEAGKKYAADLSNVSYVPSLRFSL